MVQPSDRINLEELTSFLLDVRGAMIQKSEELKSLVNMVHPNHRISAENFIHYLQLRTYSLKKLQGCLSNIGLSSIGSSERYTLANMDNILYFLHRMQGKTFVGSFAPGDHSLNFYASLQILQDNTARLFGESLKPPHTRIMVTLPSEAAHDPYLVKNLVLSGMGTARINCSHDSPEDWEKMIRFVREAVQDTGQPCKVYMDLAGPKLRTGPVKTRPKPDSKKKKTIDYITLSEGDHLKVFAHEILGEDAVRDEAGNILKPARISLTLPSVIKDIKIGQKIWFDDGSIGGEIQEIHTDHMLVKVKRAGLKGSRLRAEKGINFPETDLQLPSLTDEDLGYLPFIAENTDIVGFSFVRRPQDVSNLQKKLDRLGRKDVGLVLKIETREAFDNLPSLIMQAMKFPSVGVMIARGDLAVELGAERISEVQEEILWLCEAAHVPNIWATQVLEGLAKKGMATRAEITDASMAARSECVMLNKGPYIVEATKTLGNILTRMEAHQHKRKGTLRALHVAQYFFESHGSYFLY